MLLPEVVMSEHVGSPRWIGRPGELAWESRALGLLSRLIPGQSEPPPSEVLQVGLAAGAAEGLVVGLAHGGLDCVVVSLLWGTVVGLLFALIGWRVRRRVRTLLLSLFLAFALEVLGVWLILAFVPMLALFPLWGLASAVLLGIVIGCPFIILILTLIPREILAAFRGLIAGAILGTLALAVVGGCLAFQEFNSVTAATLGCLLGAITGLIDGILAGAILGAVVGALMNVDRRTFAPTYGSLAATVGLGVVGWLTGGEIAGEDGSAIGVLLGVAYGPWVGIKLGQRLAAGLAGEVPSLDLSNPSRLADGSELRSVLLLTLLTALWRQARELHLEPQGASYRLHSVPPVLEDLAAPPAAVATEMIDLLKQLADIDPGVATEIDRRLRIGRGQLDVHLRFEPAVEGERVTIYWGDAGDAAEAARAVGERLLFILRARRWFFSRSVRPSHPPTLEAA
jgi:hypothetical protein